MRGTIYGLSGRPSGAGQFVQTFPAPFLLERHWVPPLRRARWLAPSPRPRGAGCAGAARAACHATSCTPWRSCRTPRPPSIDNRLVDELTEQLAELALPRPGLRLGQENGDQLFLRIHPERR